jgi:uncharacterized protein YraI
VTSIDLLNNDSRIANTLATPRTRRSMLKTLAGAGAAALALRTLGPAFATEQLYTVSANANYRVGPGTNFAIIAVVHNGDTFKVTGLKQNGYSNILFKDESGWVISSLIVEAGGALGGSPVVSGQAWTSSSVNLRMGPGTSYSVIKVVPAGAKIGTSTTVKNGYRYVTDGIKTGWMSDAYITKSYPGGSGDGSLSGTATTTSSVHLREKPNTGSTSLLIIPAGAKVPLTGNMTYGFASATYNGKSGWVSMNYLDFGYGAGVPVPAYYTTTSSVNMRAQPSTSATVMLVIPAGAKVVPTGEMRDGFAVVTYNGKTGWVSRDYLK